MHPVRLQVEVLDKVGRALARPENATSVRVWKFTKYHIELIILEK